MTKDILISGYDKLEGLLSKLPGKLQKPILRELGPIKEIFLEYRAPRIAIIGPRPASPSPEQLLQRLCAENTSPNMDPARIHSEVVDNGWRKLRAPHLGSIEFFDLRAAADTDFVQQALCRHQPDLVLLWADAMHASSGDWSGMLADLIDASTSEEAAPLPPLVALCHPASEEHVENTRAALSNYAMMKGVTLRVIPDDAEGFRLASEAICDLLPNQARLQFARLSGSPAGRERVAHTLLKSFAGITGIIAVQPIPLADMPVLTSLQSLMVLMIAGASGRRINARTVGEFISALGINVGAGLILREGARNIAKFVPIGGNAVSGFIAGAGTYGIGKAAIAYFIHAAPQGEVRRVFKQNRKLKNGGNPPPLPTSGEEL
ncbi:MAG: YcjF family protein [Chthoniobacterales bacterium]